MLIIRSYKKSVQLDNKFKHGRIYSPIENKESIPDLVHEMTHAFLYYIIKNEGLPYYDPNSMSLYKEAVKESLLHLVTDFTVGTYSDVFSVEVQEILRVNFWHDKIDKSCVRCIKDIYHKYDMSGFDITKKEDILIFAVKKISHCIKYCFKNIKCIEIKASAWMNYLFDCVDYNSLEESEYKEILGIIVGNEENAMFED